MKRLIALLIIALLIVGTAFAERTELSGYLFGDIGDLVTAVDGTSEMYSQRETYRAYTIGADACIFARVSNGMITSITMIDIDTGCALCGVYVGMPRAQAETALSKSFRRSTEQVDGETAYHDCTFNDDLAMGVTYENDIAVSVHCYSLAD